MLHLRGTLASQQGHPDQARAAYESSLALREALGDEAGVAALLTNLALVAEDEDDLEGAERLGQEGLERRRALGDLRAVSVSQTNMGMLATVRGDLEQAQDRFVEAHALADEVGDRWLTAVGLHNLGNVTRDLGDLDAAAAHFLPVLDAYAEHDDRWSLAHLFEDVALWLLARGAAGDAEAVVAARGGGAACARRSAPRGSRRPRPRSTRRSLRPANAPRPTCWRRRWPSGRSASLEVDGGPCCWLVLTAWTETVWNVFRCERFPDTCPR